MYLYRFLGACRNAVTATAAKRSIDRHYFTRVHLEQGLCGTTLSGMTLIVSAANIRLDLCKLHNQPPGFNPLKPYRLRYLASTKTS